MTSALVGESQEKPRPPVAPAAPPPTSAERRLPPTVASRPWVRAGLLPAAGGVEPTDPYVRKFWTAAIGPGAVADLLRLNAAARQRRSIRRPQHLSNLISVGLAAFAGGRIWVHERIPPVPQILVARMPPFLRREHVHWKQRA